MTRESASQSNYSRRGFLKHATVAGLGSLTLAGTASAWSLEDQYRTVVDVVDAGADNGGNESITPVLREHAGDDTLLRFPSGRYYMDSQFRFTNFRNFGMVGGDATLVPANYHDFDGPRYRLFRLGTHENPGRDLRVEGFRVDQTAPDTGIRVLNGEVTDGLFVQDVYVHGLHDSGTWGPGLFTVTDPNGSGVVRRFRAFDGGIHPDETPNAGNMWHGPTGILTNEYHRGSLRYEGCVLGGFPGTGLYVGAPNGRVVVDRGWYENSETASIRLGVSSGRITGAVAAVNQPPDYDARQLPIRLDYGNWITVEDVDIHMTRPNGNAIRLMNDLDGTAIRDTRITVSGTNPTTAIRVNSQTGPTYIEDVDIDIDVSGNAIKILGTDAGEVGVQNVRITGDAGGSPVQHAIYCERDGCNFRHLEIDQPGPDRRRALLLRGDDYMVYNCAFETTNDPIAVSGDDGWIEETYASAESGSSIRLTGGAGDVVLKNNSFPDGIRDFR
ncbi:twin-arginine translocation signal domain-containing protein [Natronoglomus mannanivorans]|uniref:Twin-arginine translocation signal domain-containing protein n=1 Tax=Natronoglomus mannanivorans TaxID=2979990 RepID=A0AAP2Z019_9EURY|nr:twin-arginine translocation signal domain-containing protein [Halobacteria archaeon AArc-xg1-1]